MGDIWLIASFLDAPDWQRRKLACQILERVVGESQRASGWATTMEHDAPLLKAWYHKHRNEIGKMPLIGVKDSRPCCFKAIHATPGKETAKTVSISREEVDALWESLNAVDHITAFPAMLRLVDAQEDAIRLCSVHVRPIPIPDRNRIRHLVDKLNDSDPDVRDA